jgi:methionyl aminopeptidase
VTVQNNDQAKILREGGKILSSILQKAALMAVPGVSSYSLNEFAESEAARLKARCSFKNYRASKNDLPYPAGLCVSLNDEVVHGIPSKNKVLKEGDIVGLDLGIEYMGLFTDSAITVKVGRVGGHKARLVETAKNCLIDAIKIAKAGKKTGDIGYAIQTTAEKMGFSPVRELVGHGVGASVHEDPEVPCYGLPNTGTVLNEGLVLAIEPMINERGWKIKGANDGWTIKTADGSLSAHFEHTVLVTKEGCVVLTE